MSTEQPANPLHGVTLKVLLETLVQRYGWDGLSDRFGWRCFASDPSIRSSLKFLRKTPWARAKMERLYIADAKTREKKRRRNAMRAARRAYKATVEAAEE